jgi:aquaporin Z
MKSSPSLLTRSSAEFLGTFWLVLGGCGSAVLAASLPNYGTGLLGVAAAFGLTVLTIAYVICHISGCHLNPAVSSGLVVAKRSPVSEIPAYVSAQVLGVMAASGLLYLIASGKAGFQLSDGLAYNGYGAHSPGEYAMYACLLAEVVFTFVFVLVMIGETSPTAPAGLAPITIGLGLTTVHLIGIPITNLSVNPARSTGAAVLVGGWALTQLWMFWLAPLTGAALTGIAYPALARGSESEPRLFASKTASSGY